MNQIKWLPDQGGNLTYFEKKVVKIFYFWRLEIERSM